MNDPAPSVVVVVLNFNSGALTTGCLQALNELQPSEAGLCVVVVDNASDDDSEAVVTRWMARAGANRQNIRWFFVQAGCNGGYAAGNNLGIRFALDRVAPEFIWILNPDTQPEKAALTSLLSCALKTPDVGVWGGTLIQPGGERLTESAGGARYCPWTSRIQPLFQNMPVDSLPRAGLKLDYVNGASMFVRADLFRTIGLFDERFFLFFEELDFARRALSAGAKIGWCPGSQVQHCLGGASHVEPAWKGVTRDALRQYHENLSVLLFTGKHHRRLLPLVMLVRFGAKSVLLVLRKQQALLRPLWWAWWDFFSGRKNRFPGRWISPPRLRFPAGPERAL